MSAQHTPGPLDINATIVGPVVELRYPSHGEAVRQLYLLRDQLVQRDALLAALKSYKAAQQMPTYGDNSDFVWPKSEMRKPGETAWGWICEKHGLGYQSGCVCCRDDFKRYSDQKDREARHARDTALVAAEEQARAAIERATGDAL